MHVYLADGYLVPPGKGLEGAAGAPLQPRRAGSKQRAHNRQERCARRLERGLLVVVVVLLLLLLVGVGGYRLVDASDHLVCEIVLGRQRANDGAHLESRK